MCRCARRGRVKPRPGSLAHSGSIARSSCRARWLRHGPWHFGATAPRDLPTCAFTRREMGGAFTWDEVAQYRGWWKGNLILKGIVHPADAEKAMALGADGVIVSNHGGRQNDALSAAIDG